jgi:hypothetical protein
MYIFVLWAALFDAWTEGGAGASVKIVKEVEEAYCRSMRLHDDDDSYLRMIQNLVKGRRWNTTRAIYESERILSKARMAKVIVSNATTADAVSFLKRLPRDSSGWHVGVLCLQNEPSAKKYLSEAVADDDAYVRATCYCLAEKHNWDILLRQARVDSNSSERYGHLMQWSASLASAAKSYRVTLGDLPKDTVIEPIRIPKRPVRPAGSKLLPE